MSNVARISDHQRYEAREDAAPQSKGAQLEDGYVRTANAIVEALCKAPLTSREARIVRAVERATFGWDRPSARLSQSVLAKMTGLTPKRCSESVNALLAKKVLRRDGGSQAPIGINTRVSEWNFEAQKARVSPKRQEEPNWGLRPQNGDEKRPQDGDTNTDNTDNLEPKGSKESSKKKSPPKKWGEEIDHELADLMFARTTEDLTNPKRPNMNAWANDIRLMRTKDQRTVEQIRYLINWVADDSFWSSNVMCPSKLREKWDALEKKVRAYKEARHANRQGFDQQRENRDRVAAMLADPNDTSWADGLFDEEGDGSGSGEPGIHATGGDFSQDVENGFHRSEHGQAGQAGADYLDGEVVDSSDDSRAGHGARADQGRGRRVAAERGEAGQAAAAETGGFWNA